MNRTAPLKLHEKRASAAMSPLVLIPSEHFLRKTHCCFSVLNTYIGGLLNLKYAPDFIKLRTKSVPGRKGWNCQHDLDRALPIA